LVDFIGADRINVSRWNRDEVVRKVLPFLLEAKQAGVKSVFDCTPNFLGRDVVLLQMLTEQSGLNIVTNTAITVRLEINICHPGPLPIPLSNCRTGGSRNLNRYRWNNHQAWLHQDRCGYR